MANKFPTQYTEKKPFYSNPGSVEVPVYELSIMEKGNRDIVQVGKTNVQEAIDAEYESVDMYQVLMRIQNGDTDALMRAEAFYADVSELPTNLAEIMQMNDEGRKIFDKMPTEYRRLYGNDYMQFLADPGRLVDEIAKRKKNDVVDEDVKVNDDKEQ